MDIEQFEERKRDHIRHALDPSHQAFGLTGLDRIHLVHDALPEINFDEIKLETACLGGLLPTPFFVAGMTAGHPDAKRINDALGRICEKRGWAMGIGSQRRQLDARAPGDCSSEIREKFPRLVLFANIGITQIISNDSKSMADSLRRLVNSTGAQALAVHVNSLQEALQPEGTPRFKGGFKALENLVFELGSPVILKETGCGFSAATLERLRGIGLAAVDVSGLGGTHWGRIEGTRAGANSVQSAVAETFANWGETTVDSVIAARANRSAREIWASGGVRTGLDAAKLIALGADRVGFAQPALQAALAGEEALDHWMSVREYELKVALFCTGSANPQVLREMKGVSWKLNGT